MNIALNLIYYIIKYIIIAVLITALLYFAVMFMGTILLEMISFLAWITG